MTDRSANAASPFHVLIVEDDASVVRLVRALLQRQGMEVRSCGSAAECATLLESVAWDLLLLDRGLPDGEGAVICRAVKANSAFAGRQVIMLTGRASVDETVEGFASGADDYVTKPFIPEELVARVNAARRVIELQKKLVEANRKLEQLASTDGLTGTFNRRHFGRTLEKAFNHSIRYGRPLSLAIVDVDLFKQVNDRFGHPVGDAVLSELASRFKACIRSSDVVARYGGEEFVVVLPETHLDEAMTFADKIRRVIAEQPVHAEDEEIQVTISVGTASLPHTEFTSPAEMIKAADLALYRAKKNGRNRVEAERRRNPSRHTWPGPTSQIAETAGS